MIAEWWPGLAWALPFAGVVPLAKRSPDLALAPSVDGIPVSIIIPARNESAIIETVVRSILASTYTSFELLVVDDRSTDDTAVQVTAIAATDPRLRLIDGAELPSGWLGKPWACHQGAAAATGQYLLFTDADTEHAPALLGHAIGAMERDGPDLLTLITHQRCVTFWERIIMPQIWVPLGFRYPPSRVNRATKPHQLVANGQFILVRRTAYDEIGGHAAVQGEVVEDLALAQTFLRAGKRLRLMFGDTLIATRMYRTLGELVEGWSKNLYLGTRQSAGNRPLLRAFAPWSLVLALLFWLLPFLALATGVAPEAAKVAIGVSLLFWAMIAFGMQIPIRYALGYPLGALMAIGITLRSIGRGARRVEWRGRTYQVGEPL
ncbi:MAG: glycosyltransferase [Gemmatimonadales bacterium]|nr:glycosyltransferase [Gemmatimonadales bacterium]